MFDKETLKQDGEGSVGLGSDTMISSDIRCEKLETPARDRHEFWDGGQIPIGIGDFGVVDVGRERCHPIVDIGAMFVPN